MTRTGGETWRNGIRFKTCTNGLDYNMHHDDAKAPQFGDPFPARGSG